MAKVTADDSMVIVEVDDIQSYIDIAMLGPNTSYFPLYRGQSRPRALCPGIARNTKRKDTKQDEQDVLEQLELMGGSTHNMNGMTALDKLVLAQHHGLRTRLLDWTSNPLVALWFACSSGRRKKIPTDVYVYMLNATELRKANIYEMDPFSHDKTYVFQPRWNNPRVLAQQGWLSLHRYSSAGFVSLEKQALVKSQLKEIVIPARLLDNLMWTLDTLGVNERTLFPDLSGLCNYLNWKHRL